MRGGAPLTPRKLDRAAGAEPSHYGPLGKASLIHGKSGRSPREDGAETLRPFEGDLMAQCGRCCTIRPRARSSGCPSACRRLQQQTCWPRSGQVASTVPRAKGCRRNSRQSKVTPQSARRPPIDRGSRLVSRSRGHAGQPQQPSLHAPLNRFHGCQTGLLADQTCQCGDRNGNTPRNSHRPPPLLG